MTAPIKVEVYYSGEGYTAEFWDEDAKQIKKKLPAQISEETARTLLKDYFGDRAHVVKFVCITCRREQAWNLMHPCEFCWNEMTKKKK
jgi:hypothetical protein